jgi:hypothetical protein
LSILCTYFCNASFDQYLSYDPETGRLTWKVDRSPKVKAGSEAGCPAKSYDGSVEYRVVGFNYERYYAHRIAWELANGPIPEGYEIDHINGNGCDNRLENLRLVTRQENARNQRLPKNSSTGFIGVQKVGKRYTARIEVSGEVDYLGTFDTPEAAAQARKDAERTYGFHENHGRRAA